MSVITTFKEACSSMYNIAQRNTCVALEGASKTPAVTLAADMGVMGATLGLGLYGSYRVIRAMMIIQRGFTPKNSDTHLFG